jgi:GNAT superfamily N-acetyltransferase
LKIRKAHINDTEAVHRLSWQLGYSPDLETVQRNISQMLAHADYELVVAVDESSDVIGWMNLSIRHRIEDISFLQVAALVTDEKIRGQGIGRKLMEYAAQYARERKLPFIGLHSSKPRNEAHAFYEHIGYQKTKESFFFRKDTE